jgi:ribosomal protein RSM22 (predicted rRNA methylase)
MSSEARPGEARAAFFAAIESELAEIDRSQLSGPADALSQRYRSGRAVLPEDGSGKTEVHAYLATRAPATFATTRRVFCELASLRPSWVPRSILDVGAGPGTATWAALDVFGAIGRAVLVERDGTMAALGSRLAAGGFDELVGETAWTAGDVVTASLPRSDLVVAAYVFGELGEHREQAALEAFWEAAAGELVLVEPGTPVGFARLRAARTTLISWGAHVTAPCPGEGPCPMTGSDWCHFAVRLERSPLHRDLKRARLGYEDEKYSYLVASRTPRPLALARLVRSPRLHKGHVRVIACTEAGLSERVISRRDGEVYRSVRDARWGDRLELDPPI